MSKQRISKQEFINEIKTYNNTLVVELNGKIFVDTMKGGISNYLNNNFEGWKLKSVYIATTEEIFTAATGEGKASSFSIDGHVFLGHVFEVIKEEIKSYSLNEIKELVQDKKENLSVLNEWERSFYNNVVINFIDKGKKLSEKQQKIYDKCLAKMA